MSENNWEDIDTSSDVRDSYVLKDPEPEPEYVVTPLFDETTDIIKRRGRQWGDAHECHFRIAQTWSGILNFTVNEHQVALCMAALKLVRANINPADSDSLIDAGGYIQIAKDIGKKGLY